MNKGNSHLNPLPQDMAIIVCRRQSKLHFIELLCAFQDMCKLTEWYHWQATTLLLSCPVLSRPAVLFHIDLRVGVHMNCIIIIIIVHWNCNMTLISKSMGNSPKGQCCRSMWATTETFCVATISHPLLVLLFLVVAGGGGGHWSSIIFSGAAIRRVLWMATTGSRHKYVNVSLVVYEHQLNRIRTRSWSNPTLVVRCTIKVIVYNIGNMRNLLFPDSPPGNCSFS